MFYNKYRKKKTETPGNSNKDNVNPSSNKQPSSSNTTPEEKAETVEQAASLVGTPNTGDSTPIAGAMVLLFAGLAIMAVSARKRMSVVSVSSVP